MAGDQPHFLEAQHGEELALRVLHLPGILGPEEVLLLLPHAGVAVLGPGTDAEDLRFGKLLELGP